jgi:hypothetical protein
VGTGTLTFIADQIDVVGELQIGQNLAVGQQVGFNGNTPVVRPQLSERLPSFATTNFVSRGDIRLGQIGLDAIKDGGQFTAIESLGDLAFTAAQLYPTSGSFVRIIAGPQGSISTRVRFDRISDATPQVPMSAFGTLSVAAGTITQGGVLRAPEGAINLVAAAALDLLPGSLTSISLEGLVIPFGGTGDGLTYTSPIAIDNNLSNTGPKLTLSAPSVRADAGARLDLSGGGTLAGAGFISGRGGSVDRRFVPFDSSHATGVYALVPGYQSGYAPRAGVNSAAAYPGSIPGIGSQITIPAGVPGLPAGTYTLLPAEYSLLPGAYRVELDGAASFRAPDSVALRNGSYRVAAYTGIANTAIRASLPSFATITPAKALRTFSAYNETSYDQFVINNPSAALFGNTRAPIAADGKMLKLSVGIGDGFHFAGTADFRPAEGGLTGAAVIGGINNGNSIEVIGANGAATPGFIAFHDVDLNALGAGALYIGGEATLNRATRTVFLQSYNNVVIVRSGAMLSAAEVYLLTAGSGKITVESGATISTVGRGGVNFESTKGYSLTVTDGTSSQSGALVVSNGILYLGPPLKPDSGIIEVQAGATLKAEGSIAVSSPGTVVFSDQGHYAARNVAFSATSINIGNDATPGAPVPDGFTLSQALLSSLIARDPVTGAPGVERLTLTVQNSLNLFGTTRFDAGDAVELDLNSPAIYGYGSAGDVATIKVGTFVWNGVTALGLPDPTSGYRAPSSALPGGVLDGGPGTGSGVLDIIANRVVLGYPDNQAPFVPTGQLGAQGQRTPPALDRLVLGFGTVNLTGASEIRANNKGTLSVYQSQAAYGQPGTGGNLNIITPLLTADPGAIVKLTTGGALTLSRPAGTPARSTFPPSASRTSARSCCQAAGW